LNGFPECSRQRKRKYIYSLFYEIRCFLRRCRSSNTTLRLLTVMDLACLFAKFIAYVHGVWMQARSTQLFHHRRVAAGRTQHLQILTLSQEIILRGKPPFKRVSMRAFQIKDLQALLSDGGLSDSARCQSSVQAPLSTFCSQSTPARVLPSVMRPSAHQ